MTVVGTVEVVAKINSADYRKGGKDIEDTNKKISDSTNNTSKSTSSFESKLAGFAKNGVKVATVGLVGLASTIATLSIGGGITRALNIEDAQASLRGLGHDTKSIEAIMKSALASVKGTAFGLGDAATIASTAVAAGIKPGQELTRTLTITANAAALARIGLSEMGSILNKVWTNGKVSTEELNQLADRGIPIWTKLAESYGVSGEELRKMVSDGKVNATDFANVLENTVGNAAVEMGKTTRGSWMNMLAALSRVGEKIVSGPISTVRNGMGDLTGIIDDNSDKVVKYATKMLDIFASFGKKGKMALDLLMPSIDALTKTIRGDLVQAISAVARSDFARFIGGTLVVAANAALIAINALISIVSGFVTQASSATGILIALTSSFVAYRVIMSAITAATIIQTTAQAALNAAMLLNPIGLLAAGVVGLTAAYLATTSQTNNASNATSLLKSAQDQLTLATNAAKVAQDNLTGALRGQEGAALAVERAQRDYNNTVAQYGPGSLEAREAAYRLKEANDRLAQANQDVANKTREAKAAEEEKSKAKDAVIDANNKIAESARNAAGGYQALAGAIASAKAEDDKAGNIRGIGPKEGAAIFSVPGRASGGSVSANRPYFVGENPDGSLNSTSELFVPRTAGSVINSKTLQSALGDNSSGNREINIGSINIANNQTADYFIRKLTGNQEIVEFGLVPRQEYM